MPLFESNVYRGAMRLLVVSLILLTVALTSASPGLAQTARGPSSETPLRWTSGTSRRSWTGTWDTSSRTTGSPAPRSRSSRTARSSSPRATGEADVRDGEPVVADETLFRIASTSKLFTATAVMQLARGGEA